MLRILDSLNCSVMFDYRGNSVSFTNNYYVKLIDLLLTYVLQCTHQHGV